MPYQSLDDQGSILEVNEAWLDMLGYSLQEVICKPFTDFLESECSSRFMKHVFSQTGNGVASGMELTLRHKSGKPVRVRHHGRLLRDDEGKVLQTHCLLEDMSSSQEMEASLRHSQERYRTLVEQQNDLVVSFDAAGRLLFVSPSYCRTFDKNADEMLGEVFLPLVWDEDREHVQRSLDSLTPQSPAAYHEERALTKDGLRWFGWSVKGLFDDEGQLQEIISVGRDITQRKRTEHALDQLLSELEERVSKRTQDLETANWKLQEEVAVRSRAMKLLEASERKYRTLHESMRDGFGVVDMNGIIRETNKSFREMLGYSAKEIHGLSVKDITVERWHELQDTLLWEQVLAPGARGYTDVYEKEYRRKDGSIFPVELRSHLIQDEHGAPAGYWAIVRDISHRKKTERAMKQAQQDAETASKAKSAFLARMSHELRTPLNAIINMSELAVEEQSPEQRKEYMEAVGESGRRLLKLVNVVLDYARLDSGRLELEARDFNLYDVLHQVVAFFQLQVQEKGLALHLHFGQSLHRYFHGDPVRLQQVLINLVGNAVKYTQKGAITVDVSCGGGLCPLDGADSIPEDAAAAREKSVLCIQVTDTGVGVPADRLHSLFQAFEQGEETLSRQFEGVGMGLPLSKRLVELMDGTLQFASEPGQGTRVEVNLPLEIGAPSKAAMNTADAPRQKDANGVDSRVLDVESALQRFGGDVALYLEVGQDFLNSLEESLGKLHDSVSCSDFETTVLLAQSVQGNCGTIGAERCRRLMLEIEEAARQEQQETALSLLVQIEQVLCDVQNEMQRFSENVEQE